jgi:hypothetical protein
VLCAETAIGTTNMPSLDTAVVVLAGIVFLAAFVNGALGYGFSSLTVPVALVFYTNRILNPAVVVIEVVINVYVLLMNLSGVAAVWRRVTRLPRTGTSRTPFAIGQGLSGVGRASSDVRLWHKADMQISQQRHNRDQHLHGERPGVMTVPARSDAHMTGDKAVHMVFLSA